MHSLCYALPNTYITSHLADIKHCLSLITISLEKVQELSSFMLKRVLKYTVIKMHSASFFINGLNGAYKLVRCVACYISVEKTDKPSNTPCLYRLYSVVIKMLIGPLHCV